MPEYQTLLNIFSVAFSYPDENLFESLQNGDLVHVLREEVQTITDKEELLEQIADIEKGNSVVVANGLQSLESDYIALFEVNRDLAPVHMYAHLYNSNSEERISAMRRLQSLYQKFGLKIKQGGEGDHPDHLVIQLEFLSYLLQQLAQTESSDHETQQNLKTVIRGFVEELQWIANFIQVLKQHPFHPFYTSLALLMGKVVSNMSKTVNIH